MRSFSLLLSCCLLFAASCSEPDVPREAGPVATPSAQWVNGGECSPDGCESIIEGDADGDGVDDRLTVYATLKRDRHPKVWHMKLSTAEGEIDQVLKAGNPYSYPRALGAADVDGDGRAEWFIKVHDLTSHGAPWSTLNVFLLADKRLIPLRAEGRPLDANFGGIARLGEGIECMAGHLTLLRAEAQNVRNTRWRYSRRTYSIEGTHARFLRRTEGVLRIKDYNDPDLDSFYAIDCNGLNYP